MKNLSTVLSAISLVGVIILAVLFSNSKKTSTSGSSSAAATSEGPSVASRIAYIDIDTFEANYTLLKDKKAEFTRKKDNMEAELERSAQQFQHDLQAYQAKGATMSESEKAATEKRLAQMQQSLGTRKNAMEDQFSKEQEEFNKSLRSKLDSFLAEYNNTHHYDYILSYSRRDPQIMYANKALNITQDAIKGMNEQAGTTKAK